MSWRGQERPSVDAASRTRWSHYDRMAAHLAPAAELLAERVSPAQGLVVDVGSGSGNGLRAAAALAQPVIGLDRAAEQLGIARTCGAPQLLADVASLPFRPGSVAAAMSNFGLIFAPDQRIALAEIAGCLRPGGRIAFTAWHPDGWPQPARQVLAGHLGRRPPSFPTALGAPDAARAILGEAGFADVEVEHRVLSWEFADVGAAIDEVSHAAGGLRVLRQQLEDRGRWEAAADDLRGVFGPRCQPVDGGVAIHDRYLLYVAQAM